MKRYLLIFFLVQMAHFTLVAQTKAEKKQIIQSYDRVKINNLKEELKANFLLREAKIKNYLSINGLVHRSTKIQGKTYSIYDIIDGKPIYRTTHNLNSAKSTKTNRIQAGGSLGLSLEGENMSIGVWDEESVRGTHDEFKDNQVVPESRVVYPEFLGPFFGPISDHATHVAGTLVGKGTDSDAKGMAPKATLRSYDWTLDDQEALSEATDNGLLISNHSYGVPIFGSGEIQQVAAPDIGAYTSDARTWDQVAYTSPYYLAVNSAGNEGSENYTGGLGTGYDKLTGNKTAKNNLVVANANPFVNPLNGSLINFPINSSSSQGPTDDFRVKPDIAADGTSVYSPTSGSDSEYSTFSGTSMASPNVAGTLLLLQEYYNELNSKFMKASTLKALVCHTAIDDPSKQGPDPVFGWGLLNAEDAALLIKDDFDGTALINELSLANGATYTYEFTASTNMPIVATICWTDPAGTVQSNDLNSLTPRLVNDLDLRLEDSNSTVHTPWKLDNTNVTAAAIKGDNTVDNIERINIATSVAGTYTLTVSHKGTITNTNQDFSLILSGSNITLNVNNILTQTASIWTRSTDKTLHLRFKPENDRSRITLYNTIGKTVYRKNINTNLTEFEHAIDTRTFSKGLYFISIQSGNSRINKKVIIK